MKLYTEEQVRHLADCIHGATTESILASLTPIKLPTDEEIDIIAPPSGMVLTHRAFKLGARWMRDKIKGGNK